MPLSAPPQEGLLSAGPPSVMSAWAGPNMQQFLQSMPDMAAFVQQAQAHLAEIQQMKTPEERKRALGFPTERFNTPGGNNAEEVLTRVILTAVSPNDWRGDAATNARHYARYLLGGGLLSQGK